MADSSDDVERAAATVTAPPRSAPSKHQTTRLDLSSLPSDVADALKHWDADGDGLITTAELFRGGRDAQDNKLKVRRLVFAVVALLVVLVVQLGATFGLVFAVVAVTKDSKVDSENALVARDGSYLGTTPVLMTVTSSEVADSVFADVRSIYVETASGVAAQLAVDGFVRLPLSALGANAGGLTYGPLVLLTAQGSYALVGETVTALSDNTLDAFATAAAAQVSTLGVGSGRHLLGAAGGRELTQKTTIGSVIAGATTGSTSSTRYGGMHSMAVTAPRGL